MSQKTVLIAEDETIVSLDMKSLLHMNNYKVVSTVSSGEELISQFLFNKPDIVIADLRLHGKVSGIDAVKEIRKKDNTPIIIVSNTLRSSLERIAKDIPNVVVLPKPFQTSDLICLVNRFFDPHPELIK